MGDVVELSIAKDYSRFPSGRDERDGPNNGKRFRDEFLLPKYEEARARAVPLVVNLDGVLSFGSSFLEEAFGGMIRVKGVSRRELMRTLRLEAGWVGNERYRQAILRYIDEA